MSTTHDELTGNRTRSFGDKPFPWICFRCMKKTVHPVAMPYKAKANHDGQLHEWLIPDLEIPQCVTCGDLVFSNRTGDDISASLRSRLRLLSPDQIRENRQKLGMSQGELAGRLGTTEGAIQRWEEGAMIQSRVMDNLLRVFFALPAVRCVLTGVNQDPSLGLDISPSSGR